MLYLFKIFYMQDGRKIQWDLKIDNCSIQGLNKLLISWSISFINEKEKCSYFRLMLEINARNG